MFRLGVNPVGFAGPAVHKVAFGRPEGGFLGFGDGT